MRVVGVRRWGKESEREREGVREGKREGAAEGALHRAERDDLVKILTKQFACQTIKRLIG